MLNFTATPPLSLYIHVPWCVRKCPYCDFNSHEVRNGIPEQDYIQALVTDLEQALPSVWGRSIETVFIGGGTPSLLSSQAIDFLLGEVRARVPLKPAAEITLEANPGTVDQARFAGFREAGINRLSVGIQSFQDTLLAAIGRIHNAREALLAIEAAHSAGFDNFNLDLMFGLPGQTTSQALADLQQAVAVQPAHISWYELTIEPNTWFHRHPPARPDDETLLAMQAGGQELLADAGYLRYEVSAFARPGRQCRHNLNYWQFGDYLGIGAGAHSKITDAATQTVRRVARVKHPRSYIERVQKATHISSRIELSTADIILEYLMNSLRLSGGFSKAEFSASTGLDWPYIEPQLTTAIDNGWLSDNNGRIRTTLKGQRYLDELLQQWLPEPSIHAETR